MNKAKPEHNPSDLAVVQNIDVRSQKAFNAALTAVADYREALLARFETLAAGYHTVGNDDAARGIRELCAEIRKDGV